MLTVETLIGNLLLQHNCVVVPGFGGFVAQRVAARLDELTSTMHPPKKSVLFNKQLISNDGLLIQAYAHHAKLNYSEAEIAVKNCIGTWERQLNEGQRVSIDKVGILFLDKERNLSFEQDRFYNLLLESYGLGSIHFISVEDVQALVTHDQIQLVATAENETPFIAINGESIPVFEATNEETPILPIKRKTKVLKYAVAACTLPILFYSFWIPMKTDALQSGIITFNDFNPFQKHTESHYKPAAVKYTPSSASKHEKVKSIPENIDTYSYELDEDTYIPVKVSDNKNQISTSPPVVSATSIVSGNKGLIIVGSYSTIENAQKQVEAVNALGFNGEIIQKDGKIRVSVGSGNQFAKTKSKLAENGIDCWLLD